MKEYFAKLKSLFRWRDVIFAVVLMSITLMFAFCNAQTMMDVTFGETALDVTSKRYSMNIPYDMVESVEIGEVDLDDEIIKGKGDIALRTGHCINKDWGEYYCVLDLQTSKCILIRLNDGRIFAFSHKSDEKVQEDFNTFQSYLNK
jgi:hypothetical protein